MNPQTDVKDEFLTLSQIAEYLKVPLKIIESEIDNKQLKAKQIGDLIIVQKIDLIKYLKKSNIGINRKSKL